jgi:hypothetical protein
LIRAFEAEENIAARYHPKFPELMLEIANASIKRTIPVGQLHHDSPSEMATYSLG